MKRFVIQMISILNNAWFEIEFDVRVHLEVHHYRLVVRLLSDIQLTEVCETSLVLIDAVHYRYYLFAIDTVVGVCLGLRKELALGNEVRVIKAGTR